MLNDLDSMFPDKRNEWLWIVTVCALLTLAFTYPVWTAPHRLLNDIGDARLNTWILAWGAHAITTAPATIFDANIFYPRSNALALSENLLGSMPLAAPFALAGQPVLGYNVVLLLSFFLFMLTTTLWVRYLTGSLAAGLVAGTAAAFAPSRMDHLPQIQLLAAQWLPLSLLLVTRYADTGRARHIVGASCLVALQYWAGIQITLIFAPFVALYAAAMLRWRGRSLEVTKTAIHLAASAALFVALVLPISLPYMSAAEEGMSRRLVDSAAFSAQPKNYLSPSESNRMAHMQALRRYRGTESNHFAGITVWAVLGLTSLSLLVSAWRNHQAARTTLAIRALRFCVLAAAGSYIATIVAAFTREADWLISTLAPAAPATILCLGLAALLLTDRPASSGKRVSAFWLLLALAAIGYLLSHGPTVRAWGSELGMGPFTFLYELKPYQSIRAVGRFGLATSLFLSAAVGVAVSLATKTWLRLRWFAPAVLVLVVAEYWVAPLSTHDVTLADEEAYAALAGLPGSGAVLHIPVQIPPVLAATTEYLLGSTHHWRPLLNGYSGFLPATVRQLAMIEPFSQAFFDFVQAEAPVEYVLLHGDKMDSEQFEVQRTAAEASRYLERVGDYDQTLVYRWRPQVRSGVLLNRSFSWADLTEKPLVIEVRRVRNRALDVELSWGNRIVGRVSLGKDWQALSFPPPANADREANGSIRMGLRVVPTARWDRPLGGTGTSLRADVLVDAQANGLAVAISDVWQVVKLGGPAILCVVLSTDGRHVVAAKRFAADDGGIRSAADYIEALAPGAVVAVGILDARPEDDSAAASTLRGMIENLGGRGRVDGSRLHRYVLLGVRGAVPGTAPEQHSFSRAAVRAGPRTSRLPVFEMR